jgi:predicted HTH transcriptional regulator
MNQMMMRPSEAIKIDEDENFEIRKLAFQGEGIQLEFKHKATHPEKVVREMIAFANTHGGTILIGVDDDGSIVGVKYPEEELSGIQKALNYCKPPLVFNERIFALRENRFIIRLDIPESERRPHFFAADRENSETFVRVNDMSIKASAEMQEIVRRKRKKKDIQFTYGEHENLLMKYLEEKKTITLSQFRELTDLNRFKASRKLILLVLADILNIEATEKGDIYSRKG